MKKLNSKGYKVSAVDKKALEHFLAVTPHKWASDAIRGMVNKAVKTIMRDGFELYKATQTGNITADLSVIIPGILALDGIVLHKRQTPDKFDGDKPPKDKVIARKEPVSEEIWPDGFDVEDYEEVALQAIYEDPEAMLEWFMTNKIHQRRKAFVKQHEAAMLSDPEVTEIPAHQDDFINCVCAKPGYKNRCECEAEIAATL